MLAHKERTLLLFIAPWIMALLLVPMAFATETAAASTAASDAADVAWAAEPTATPVPTPEINAPGGGEALQGQVTIIGSTDMPGFRSMELAFAYQADTAGTWFLLQQSGTPVKQGTLTTWDTTTITDGVYQVRMQVFLQDGQVLERRVTGLRVRNYTAIETSTPEVRPPGEPTITPTATPRADFQPGPVDVTPLPTNPAQITGQHLGTSAMQGVLAVLGAALLGGLYAGLRAVLRR